MTLVAIGQFAILVVTAFCISSAILWLYGRFLMLGSQASRNMMIEQEEGVVFHYSGPNLVEVSPSAIDLIGDQDDYAEITDLVSLMSPRFPEIGDATSKIKRVRQLEINAVDGVGLIRLSYEDGVTRIELIDALGQQNERELSGEVDALHQEIETLRATTNAAPFLVWREDDEGAINWANTAYLDLVKILDPTSTTTSWPPARIFPITDKPYDAVEDDAPVRMGIDVPGEIRPRWFERHEVALAGDRLNTAISIDDKVRVETTLRDFVQTLTKTFAHLTVGLAIFDKQRKLALFNPALVDLTSLKPELLSSRPTMQAFLDRLRDRQMIPEPRDYKSWRQRMFELESQAQEGTFVETWNLPTGQTFRVSGRPHPDGAIAFLFEDKSAETSLMRSYRTEIDTSRAVLDTFGEAVAVFSPAGNLNITNAAYQRLWQQEEKPNGQDSIGDMTGAWAALCAPTPSWGDIRDFVLSFDDRTEWQCQIRMNDGRGLTCKLSPLAGGSTLVVFKPDERLTRRRLGRFDRRNEIEDAEVLRVQEKVEGA